MPITYLDDAPEKTASPKITYLDEEKPASKITYLDAPVESSISPVGADAVSPEPYAAPTVQSPLRPISGEPTPEMLLQEAKNKTDYERGVFGFSERLPKPTTTAGRVMSAVASPIAGVADYATSPKGVSEMAIAAAAPPVMAAKWAFDMAKGAKESAERIIDAFADPENADLNQVAQDVGNFGAGVYGASKIAAMPVEKAKGVLDSARTEGLNAKTQEQFADAAKKGFEALQKLKPVVEPTSGQPVPEIKGVEPETVSKAIRVEANDHPKVAEQAPQLLPEIVKDELAIDKSAYDKDKDPNPPKEGEQNAEAIRSDTGQLPASGEIPKTGQEISGNDVEQTAPVQPEPVGEGGTNRDLPPEAQNVTTPVTQPFSEGSKVRIGQSPQPHTILSETTDPRFPDERIFKVKNDKTGREFETDAGSLKQIQERSAEQKAAAPKRDLDAELMAAKLDPSVFKNASEKRAALKREKAKANAIADDWTSATREPNEVAPEATASLVEQPPTTEAHAGLPLPKFKDTKMSPLDRATTQHSAKLQKSFDEARRAQKEIVKAVPDANKRAAISIWMEADGDLTTLAGWEASARGNAFKQAAKDAQLLSPEEIAIARKAKSAFDTLHTRGTTYDVLKNHRDNYVPHVWDVKPPESRSVFSGRSLQQRFKFAKARTFNTFAEGDAAGFTPKTLEINKLLPAYLHEMNKVIADRQFVKDMAGKYAKDGRPLIIPRGIVKEVTEPSGDKTYLVLADARNTAKDAAGTEIDQSGYQVMPNQPALHAWKWRAKDEAGNPIFMESDLALHPEAFKRIRAMLGSSRIRQWYSDTTGGGSDIPKAVIKALDKGQSIMKREMFGLLAPFHQVQEGTHAVGHLVNPFGGIPKVNMSNPAMMDAANHGLMILPDRTTTNAYMEGVGAKSSWVSQAIRNGGPVGRRVSDIIDGYQDYLFHQYIPGLKFKTYEAMLGRNMKLYADELRSGAMTPADVKMTTAQQANAAYGHLNYALIDRSPTVQHFIQLGALAPDFLEARGKFVAQAIKGLSSKTGHEQFKAIAILAAAQAGAAYTIAQLTGGKWDGKHPFEVVYGNRRYSMRSVPEDILNAIQGPRQFAFSRINPLTVKTPWQLLSGLNYRGEHVGPIDTLTEAAAGYIPITARNLPGIRSLTETSRKNPVSPLQSLAGSIGLRISRYSPISETYGLAKDWQKAQGMPQDTGSYPISKYQQLRYALEDGDMEKAQQEYAKLRATMTPEKLALGFRESVTHPFTDNKANDENFAKSLSGNDKLTYQQAVKTRENILKSFDRLPKK